MDVPEWFFAETAVLAKMSSVRIKLICRQILLGLCGEGLNYEKLAKLTSSRRLSFSRSDVKAIIAGLEFILANAGKYDVEPDVLQEELMQLGLPQDTCLAVRKGYEGKKDAMRAFFRTKSLKLPQLTKVDWRVDYLLSSSDVKSLGKPSVRMNLTIDDPRAAGAKATQSVAFEMSADKLRVFAMELKTARDMMANA